MKNSRVVQFVIDGKELYLEKVLVETSVPLFFICKDDNDIRYSVLCTDTFEFKYVLNPIMYFPLSGLTFSSSIL